MSSSKSVEVEPVTGSVGSDERFRLLVEQVAEYAIFLLDPNGRVASWNAGAQRLKGYRAEEILGRHFSVFYRPEDQWKCTQELEGALRDGRVEDEGWRVRMDGSLFWANVIITRLVNGAGELVGFAKITRDRTERRKAEENLRQSEERFRLLVESVKDYAIFMLDPRGMVTTWNQGAQRIKGYQADEIIGRHFSRFYPEADVRAGKCEMELDVAAREGRFEDEDWRVRKDGTRIWANVVITALRDATGELIGFAKVTRDLTERRRAEQERLRVGELARQRIAVLTDLGEELARALSIEEIAGFVVEAARTFSHADTATLYLLDRSTEALGLLAERGCNETLLERIRVISPASGNPVHAIGVGRSDAVWIEDEKGYEAYFPAMASSAVGGKRARGFWCVPLVAGGATIGLLAAGFHDPRPFPEEEREFILTFARQSAQAIARGQQLDAERAAAARADRLGASLSTTVRSIGDAVIATDAVGAVTLMNGVAEELTGWTEVDAIGHHLADVFVIVNEHTGATVESPVEKVLRTGGVVGLANHTILVSRDGRRTPIDDSGAPIRAGAGPVQGVVLVFRDVTERKREEEKRAFLVEATATLASSLDYERTVARLAELTVPRISDWCAVDLVAEGERLPRRLAVAHVEPEKVALAKELAARYPEDPDADRGLARVLRTGQPELWPEITDDVLVAGARDAEHLRLARTLGLRSAMLVPLIAKGRVLGAITLVSAESGRRYDATDLRFAEELAERCATAVDNARLYASEQAARRIADVASRTKDEFLAMVSHELRTPLNAIMGWARILAGGDLDDGRRRRAVQTVERNAVAMAQLIEDLLDMSRVVSGKLRLEVGPTDLPSVLRAALDSIKPAADSKRIDLSPAPAVALPSLLLDSARIQQVVSNLLSNAVKFTQPGGRVTLSLGLTRDAAVISVSDTGRGIAPDFLPHVFEAFRQEDASTSRSFGGLGLGLAITRQLVELHGGRVYARSDGEGRGATFVVELPLAAGSHGPDGRAPQRDTAEKPTHLRGLRVLVVDDDGDARLLVSTILEDCGCRVVQASSVDEALLALPTVDVLLSDVAMPEQDGYDLIKLVRALPREGGGDMPAAAITAFARPEDRMRLLNAGFSIHLPKPIEPAELIAVVATLSRFLPGR